MIDIDKESLVTLADAAKSLPRATRGKPVHVKTVARWALAGLHGIVLDTVMVGGRRMTSVQACKRFFHELTHGSKEGGQHAAGSSDVQEKLAARGYKVSDTRRQDAGPGSPGTRPVGRRR